MPSLRRPSGRASARVALLVLTFVSLAAALVCVEPPPASACPMVLPKTLRMLYMESELIAVARVGDSVAGETDNDSAQIKTTLRISSLLKGESKERVLDLHHDPWGETGESSPHVPAKGDVLLVFLNPAADGDGYISADYERGVKKLRPDDLKVYVSRIEELAALMSREKPDGAALTEWLVRCVEEPATRWEGAYDLAPGTAPFSNEEEAATDAGAGAAKTEGGVVNSGDDQTVKPESPPFLVATTLGAACPDAYDGTDNSAQVAVAVDSVIPDKEIDFAAHLTPAQKERLIAVLLAAEELGEGERMLLSLIGNWKDARLVPFSLKHLGRMADKPLYHGEDLMWIVAHTLGDRTLIELAAEYHTSASYVDLFEEEEGTSEEEDSEATPAERAALKKEREELKAAIAEARLRRNGKMRHFLALAHQPQKP